MNDRPARLPEGGPERQIFLNALHEYRNSCQPPELTPGCPFFTWTSNGPACGEQCADLLAQYGDKSEGASIDLGAGLILVRGKPRRRPRRSPDSSDLPFDARRIFLEDADRAHADRRTVALIVELSTLITIPPEFSEDASERSYDIRAAREQLEIRGFDTDNLIRYGIGASLPLYFAAPILFATAREDQRFRVLSGDVSSLGELPQPTEEWDAFFRNAYQTDVRGSARGTDLANYILHGFLDRVRDWLEVASIDEIVEWEPPANYPVSVRVPALEADSGKGGRREVAVWITDRFTIADLNSWSLSSLHLEWRYLHGNLQSPCSPAAMAERKIDAQGVARAIADEVSVTQESETSTAQKLIPIAAEHLRNGKPEIAAAIFEAIVSICPADSDAHNNLGFCMLPIDPVAALSELELADKLSGGRLVTLANRVLALHLAGRDADALALATSDRVSDFPSYSAKMWVVGDHDELLLTEVEDLRTYLVSLVTYIEGKSAF